MPKQGFMVSIYNTFMTDDMAFNSVIERMGERTQEIFKELKR